MLRWSHVGYKFTLGIGSLALTGMMAELWKEVVPFWVIAVLALLPFAVFIFVQPGELPPRFVRWSHAFASAWYVATGVVLLVAYLAAGNLARGWVIYPLFVSVGFVPCAIVLWRVACGRYVGPEEAPTEGDE